MSFYTTELRNICQSLIGITDEQGYPPVQSICEQAAPLIFEKFPIFDESYRLPLEVKILRHYYMREIAQETFGLWKLYLNNRMNEIMPYYNQLYLSEQIKYDPIRDVDVTREYTRKGADDKNANVKNTLGQTSHTDTTNATKSTTNTNSDANSTDESNSRIGETQDTSATKNHMDKYADTPNGSLVGTDLVDYLTNARQIQENDTQTDIIDKTQTADSTSNSSATTDSSTDANATGTMILDSNQTGVEERIEKIATTEDYVEHLFGKHGAKNYSEMINDYRKSLLNIDVTIIDRLSDLFFNLY